ncbi:MAG TPA: hypothetical protein EYP86_03535 [Candidatus Altiarchaeales archaeon]|nr:hypothetical protein [Candidatus Altiarchaeales archaeon]
MAKKKTDPIISNIDEVAEFSIKLQIFEIIINTVLISLTLAIIFRIFAFYALLAIFFGILYFILAIIHLLIRSGKFRFEALYSIVDRYPSLDERLQTAYDNRKVRNIILDSLRSEVSSGLEKMRYSSFLETGPIVTKILVSIVLIFTLLSINFINFEGIDMNPIPFIGDNEIIQQIANSVGLGTNPDKAFNPESGENFTSREKVNEDLIGGGSGGKLPGINEGPLPGEGGGVGSEENPNIFGDPSSAKIYGENLDMEMHPEYGGEIEIKNIGRRDLTQRFSDRLRGKSADIPEQEPVKYEKMIRKYFLSLQDILKEEK